MKKKMILIVSLLMFLLPGCLVVSIHPFYTDKDIIYKPELTGQWMDHDSGTWIIAQHMQFSGLFKPDQPGRSYEIKYTDKKGTSDFIAHLFQLGNDMYLDFYPYNHDKGNDLENFHLVPSHSLARVEFKNGQIVISWYNQEWLTGLFNKNKIRIAHERTPFDINDKNPDHEQVVLTASTMELQKFIRKYGDDPEAFKKGPDNSDYTFILYRK